MTIEEHKCPTCDGRDINVDGINLAMTEVVPFFKKEVLKLRYPNHPIPMKYEELLNSLLCYSQALQFNRVHSIEKIVFYTSNKWMLKYSKELEEAFGMATDREDNAPINLMIACEYNTREKSCD